MFKGTATILSKWPMNANMIQGRQIKYSFHSQLDCLHFPGTHPRTLVCRSAEKPTNHICKRDQKEICLKNTMSSKKALKKDWILDFPSQEAKISQHFMISGFNLCYSISTAVVIA